MRKIIKKLFYFIIGLFPKNNKKIVLESHPDFSDSSKVLYDYLQKNGKRKYKFIWLVDNPQKYKQLKLNNTKFININKPISLKYLYHVITSKYLMFCNREIRWIDLKKQIVISLTHGIPIKSCKGKFPKETTFNYLLATSEKEKTIIANEYCSPIEKCFVANLPRNDLLFEENHKVKTFLKDYQKVIVWLPTYRKHKNVDIIDSSKNNTIPLLSEKDLINLNKKLSQNKDILILKFHPAEDLSKFKSKEYSNIIIMSQEDLNKLNIHLYSLLAHTDALLTDYSSVSLDYILKDKPIGYVLDDINEYKNNRGFCIDDIEEVIAGQKIYTPRDLFNFIDDVSNGIDKYQTKRTKVKNYYHKYQKNNICKIIAEKFDL